MTYPFPSAAIRRNVRLWRKSSRFTTPPTSAIASQYFTINGNREDEHLHYRLEFTSDPATINSSGAAIDFLTPELPLSISG